GRIGGFVEGLAHGGLIAVAEGVGKGRQGAVLPPRPGEGGRGSDRVGTAGGWLCDPFGPPPPCRRCASTSLPGARREKARLLAACGQAVGRVRDSRARPVVGVCTVSTRPTVPRGRWTLAPPAGGPSRASPASRTA